MHRNCGNQAPSLWAQSSSRPVPPSPRPPTGHPGRGPTALLSAPPPPPPASPGRLPAPHLYVGLHSGLPEMPEAKALAVVNHGDAVYPLPHLQGTEGQKSPQAPPQEPTGFRANADGTTCSYCSRIWGYGQGPTQLLPAPSSDSSPAMARRALYSCPWHGVQGLCSARCLRLNGAALLPWATLIHGAWLGEVSPLP